MKRLLFVINPRSGKGQIRNKLLGILDIFTKAGYEIEIHITQRPMQAREIVESKAHTVDIIACSGGDGTLNETISGLMKEEEPPLLVYIPAGTTNDFATSMGIPKNMLKAARLIEEGIPYAFDIGTFDERYFAYVAAFGAFTDVPYMTPQEVKNVLGHPAYVLEGVKRLPALKSHHMRVEYENIVIEDEFIYGMITNTISVGGFKGLVARDVALNDGIFEILLIKTPKNPMDMGEIVSFMVLKDGESEYVHKFKTNQIKIQSQEKVDWVLDGEFGGSKTEVQITNKKQALMILRDMK